MSRKQLAGSRCKGGALLGGCACCQPQGWGRGGGCVLLDWMMPLCRGLTCAQPEMGRGGGREGASTGCVTGHFFVVCAVCVLCFFEQGGRVRWVGGGRGTMMNKSQWREEERRGGAGERKAAAISHKGWNRGAARY